VELLQPDLLDAKMMDASWSAISGARSEFRWHLGRRWDDRPLMLVVGHNPSTADSEREDPTTRRWAHFARAWGHGGYIAVNLYPYRATDVDRLYHWRDGYMESSEVDVGIAMSRNLDVVHEMAERCERVVACWGDLAREPGWVDAIVRRLRSARPNLHCFGYTKGGAPKHVMARGKSRVPDDAQPIPYPPLA